MQKDIEKQFLKAYQSGGVVHTCIDVIRQRYDLGFLSESTPLLDEDEWAKSLYQNIFPKEIKKAVETFDDSVIKYLESPLMDEISDNLSECQTMKEKERYINSLIVPFHELSELFYPTLAPKERHDKLLKVSETSRNFWQQNTERKETQRQLEAIEDSISEEVEQQERLEMISTRFFEIINKPKDDVEKALRRFCHIKHMFANRLDALCLVNDIDLMRLQKECGTYLITCRDITLLMDYIGSIELAQKYIDELSKEEYIEQSKQPQPEPTNQHFTRSFTPDGQKLIFERLTTRYLPKDTNYSHLKFVFGGTAIPDNEKPFERLKWLRTKQLLRELLEGIKHTDTSIAELERQVPSFFVDKKKTPFSLANNKEAPSAESDYIKDLIKDLATL